MKNTYKIGQYTGVKMADGSYKVCRILQIYEPGKPGPFCKRETYTEVYTNGNDHPTFWLDGGWITVPDIFFKSKRDADLWLLKKKFESVSKELVRERTAHKRTLERLRDIRKAISKL